jgi:hypothetical protein
MADSFKLLGSYETTPLGQPLSFAPGVIAQINEGKTLKVSHTDTVTLDTDSPVSVSFGGVVNANIVILKAIGGKVRARITSSEGSAQAVPFDTYWILMSDTSPVTAFDLTRVAGTLTTVRVFLGEKS